MTGTEWLGFIGFFVVAFLCKDKFKGFIPAVFSLLGLLVVFVILDYMGPQYSWGMIIIAGIAFFFPRVWKHMQKAIYILVVLGVLCFVVYKNFMV